MQEQECTLDVKAIEAAVAGEKWALEWIVQNYISYLKAHFDSPSSISSPRKKIR